ncbi:hypothetical protein MHYP_G00086950 [Metynnis hypsauchen]
MARRSGPYKRYLESDTERIPRRTKFRWNAKSNQEDGWLHANNEDDEHSLLNVYNYDEHYPRNTGDDRSNNSSSEDEINKLSNEDFEKDVEEVFTFYTYCGSAMSAFFASLLDRYSRC